MNENDVNITEQQNAESTQEGEKTFTQDEVNRIVEKRLNRERSRLNGLLKEDDPREAALADRERAVAIKELQADAREALAAKGIPAEALELLNYTDKESCDKSMEAVKNLMDTVIGKTAEKFIKGDAPPRKGPSTLDETDAIKAAFRLH